MMYADPNVVAATRADLVRFVKTSELYAMIALNEYAYFSENFTNRGMGFFCDDALSLIASLTDADLCSWAYAVNEVVDSLEPGEALDGEWVLTDPERRLKF
jgi:hypothetical protein